MTPELSDILLLTLRENTRLKRTYKLLYNYDLPLHELDDIREGFIHDLGFEREAVPLIEAMDKLIEAGIKGRQDDALVGEVLLAIRDYIKDAILTMDFVCEPVHHYFAKGEKMHQEYIDHFKARFEPKRNLPVSVQGQMIRDYINPLRVNPQGARKLMDDFAKEIQSAMNHDGPTH